MASNGIEVARAYVTIVPSLEGAQKEMTKELVPAAEKSGEKAGEKAGVKVASGIGSALKKSVKVIATGLTVAVTAAAAGISKIVKSSVEAFGEFEQLEGGIETLFGDAAQKVMNDASKAFKTAGLSANEYMETSIQSAAALINSLGGNQKKAADLMSMSITDMADNVNKMGTNMESVQNAYRGFSRGNFTMLDNLALGFAGTKTGMEQLLKKAEEISGFKYDISSYADIVQAIHVVQTEMGITGTTQKEAEKTIQGSLASLKAAWKNFTTYIAVEGANLDGVIDNLVVGVENVLSNVEPVIERVLQGISSAITSLAPILVDKLPAIVNEMLPPLLSAAVSLVGAIGQVIMKSAPILLTKVLNIIQDLLSLIASEDTINSFINSIMEVFNSLVSWFTSNVGILFNAVADIILNLEKAITEPSNIKVLIDAVLDVIFSIIHTIYSSIPQILESAISIFDNLLEAFEQNGSYIIEYIANMYDFMIEKLAENLPTLLNYLPTIVEKIIPIVIEVVQSIILSILGQMNHILEKITELLPTIIDTVVQILTQVLDAIITELENSNFLKVLVEFVGNILKQLPKLVQILIKALPKIIKPILNALPQIITAVVNMIVQYLPILVDGVVELILGILNEIPTLVDAIIEVIEAIVEHLPDILVPLIESVPKIIGTLVQALIKNLPALVKGIVKLVVELVKKIPKILGLVWDAVVATFDSLWTAFSNSDAGGKIIEFFTNLWESVKEVWNTVATWFDENVIQPIVKFFKPIIETVSKIFKDLWIIIKAVWTVVSTWFDEKVIQPTIKIFKTIWTKVSEFFTNLWEDIKEIWNLVSTWFDEKVIQPVVKLFKDLWETIKKPAIEAVKWFLKNIAEPIALAFATAWDTVSYGAEVLWWGIKKLFADGVNVIIGALNGAISLINKVGKACADIIGETWEDIEPIPEIVTESFDSVGENSHQAAEDVKKSFAGLDQWLDEQVAEPSKEAFKNAFSSKTGIGKTITDSTNAWKTALGTVAEKAKKMPEDVSAPANSSLNGLLKKTKQTMNDISAATGKKIPHPTVEKPHFTVSPKGWKYADLLKGVVPKFGIEWYAKAMEKGIILNGATIFGAMGNKLLGGGETGSETVVGTKSLMNMIQSAVNKASGTIDRLRSLQGTRNINNNQTITVNVYGAEGQNVESLADIVMDRLQDKINEQEAVFA